jgi:hypothetical protein
VLQIGFAFIKTFLIFFSAVIAIYNFRHCFTSKLKAVFRYLTESRLSVSTLLTAYCEHKKSVTPLDNIIVSRIYNLSIT